MLGWLDRLRGRDDYRLSLENMKQALILEALFGVPCLMIHPKLVANLTAEPFIHLLPVYLIRQHIHCFTVAHHPSIWHPKRHAMHIGHLD